jgi:hypothetical protein
MKANKDMSKHEEWFWRGIVLGLAVGMLTMLWSVLPLLTVT